MSQKYLLESTPGIWNCQICNFVADGTHPNVLMTHLFDVHKIKRKDGSFQQYLDAHFDIPKCCCGCGENVRLHRREFGYSLFSLNCDGLKHSRNPSRIEFYLHLGLETDEAIAAFRNHKSKTAKKYSTENLRKELVALNSGARNPASYKSIQRRTGKSKRQIQRELSEKTKGDKNGFANKDHTTQIKRKSALQAAINRSKQSRIVTRPELAMWGALHALEINFSFEYLIDKYCVDFLLGKNIIIEVYGDYWHSDRMTSNGINNNRPKSDQIKNNLLESLGYVVYVFWESEIMKTPQETFKKLKKIINKHNINKQVVGSTQ